MGVEDESALAGGFINQVVRVGPTVRRRSGARSDFVRELLTLFEEHGWSGAPRLLGTDDQGREIYEYLEGQAALTPEERRQAGTDEGVVRVARLVRAFHDLTCGTPLAEDQEVVCHNDLSPRNTIYRGWRPVAFIDWDLAAPGKRIHDVAHVCWQYLDLGPGVADIPEAARRLRMICDAYGPVERPAVVETVLWWQDRCRRGIEAGAARGEPAMIGLRDLGVVDEVLAAHEWVLAHQKELAG
ncbi:phosphotransferase [Streptomyces sporangiiformans]|uniref:Trifolitoxin immunity protein n=1 Tax=Streptomyces sporangiiformans TaxID=2315329 RepID=A0A505DPL7_9ACTN|nr:phosphotransferase [Streptomyces sporangiiformans]TPQ23175.1 trifolitoxin immunity protein [Streptomyces sporangiiformans]